MMLGNIKYAVFGGGIRRVYRWDSRDGAFFAAWRRLWLVELMLMIFYIGVGKSAFCNFPKEVYDENTLGQFVSVLEVRIAGSRNSTSSTHL